MRLCLRVVHSPDPKHLGRTIELGEGACVIGRGKDASIVLEASGVSRTHARIERRDDGPWLVDLSSHGTFVGAERVKEVRLEDGTVFGIGALWIRFLVDPPPLIIEHVYDPERPDGLTGLMTRAGSRAVFARLREAGEPLAVVAIGIDGIRRINDDRGHLLGDDVIRAVARCVASLAREGDTVFRYDSDQTVWLLPGTSLDDAIPHAERARAAIAALVIDAEAGPVSVTASVGVAACGHPDTETWPALEALWQAKRRGKNRVERYPEPEDG